MTDAELFVRGPIVQDFFPRRTICDTRFQVSKRKLNFILEQHFQRDSDHYSAVTFYLSLSRFCHLRTGIWDLAMWHAPRTLMMQALRAVVRKATVHLCSLQKQKRSHGDKKGTKDGDKQDSDRRGRE